MRGNFKRLMLIFVGLATMAGCSLNQEELYTAVRDAVIDAQTQTAKDGRQNYDLGYVVGRVIHYVSTFSSTKEDWVKEEGKNPVRATTGFPGTGAAAAPEVCSPDAETKIERSGGGEEEVKVVGKQNVNFKGTSSATNDADKNTVVAYVTETKSTSNDTAAKRTDVAIAAGGARTTTISQTINPSGTFSFFGSYWSDGRYVYSASGSLVGGMPGSSVLIKKDAKEGDVWFNGSTLYFVVGTEELTIGDKTITATKILMRQVTSQDPTGIDMLAFCTTEQESNPGTPATNVKTLLLQGQCNTFGSPINSVIGQTGYLWVYENMIVKEISTTWVVRLVSSFLASLGLGSVYQGYIAPEDTTGNQAIDTCRTSSTIPAGTALAYKKVVGYSIEEVKSEKTADKIEDTEAGVVDENATPASAPTSL